MSWKTRAAQIIGMRIRRPRPSTLLCRSLAGGFLTARVPLVVVVVVMASCFWVSGRGGGEDDMGRKIESGKGVRLGFAGKHNGVSGEEENEAFRNQFR